MDFALIGRAVGALSLMGLISAGLLAVASKKFHVEVDPLIEAVFAALPGGNCGACGNPSCFAVAELIAAGTKPANACVAGGQTVADAVAEVMGVEAGEVATVVSCRHCGGGRDAARAFDYSGLLSCASASRLAGGDLVCRWGCFGYGDCFRACPFDAIRMDERGLPVVDLVACTGCGICVRECPRGSTHLLELVSENAPVAVRCSAHDKPAPRKKACPHACIACKKCEKACAYGAIVVVDALAVVDYAKCTACGACVDVCPQDCIDLFGRAAIAPAHEIDGKARDVAGFAPERAAVADEGASESDEDA